LRLLILGGTKFVGRALTKAALERKHDVTLFNRGVTNPDLFTGVEHLAGDRDGDLSALEGRTWDAVVDTCGYVPRVVRASAELLAPAVGHYTFVSSGSVYGDSMAPDLDESAPVATVEDETSEDIEAHYGPLKALCEQAVERLMPGKVLHVRAGLIVGPHDPTGRFTYWVHRIAQGGDVLAPEPGDQPVQFIDVRDLAGWILDMIETGPTGVFNATGPAERLTMRELLEGINLSVGGQAGFTWVGEQFLLERQVEPWQDLPLWLATTENPGYAGFLAVNVERALGEGLAFRSLEETVRDTLAFADTTLDAGLAPDREGALLREWATRASVS
jgi:2'-hydroxyisoflavone reductase